MRQLLGQTGRVAIARMPRPICAPGTVLVRVGYSMVSVGTEIASIAPPGAGETTLPGKGAAYATLAWTYLGKALADPRKAARRLADIAERQLASFAAAAGSPPPPTGPETGAALAWEKGVATAFDARAERLRATTDPSPGLYQAVAAPVAVPAGYGAAIEFDGEIKGGALVLGLLGPGRAGWVGTGEIGPGRIKDRLPFDLGGATEVSLVIANAAGGGPVEIDGRLTLVLRPPAADGLPATEMGQQGWHLGYSVAGEVVQVGAGVDDLAPGDRVACAGATKANHADFVAVPRNLVVRVPPAVSLKAAASVTVGAIALQGVRRASPQLGETVCVVGLGLIGLIAAQLARAAGCTTIGFDPDPERVARAKALGLDAGASTPEALLALLRDATGGRGADATLVCAAAKSDEPANLAIEATRAKGRVVLVGDVGLGLKRPTFYRKELDVLMSTSYGPGRYDRAYEEDGKDYPFAYVRWTLGRNMRAYLELIAQSRIDVEALIDLEVPIAEAARAYAELARPGAGKPLGVLLRYDAPGEGDGAGVGFDATAVALRGARAPREGAIGYALIGAGGFGAGMLVPALAAAPGPFELRCVVSRDPVRGGNLARQHRAASLASDPAAALASPDIEAVVVATRHDEHADMVCAALAAGKHVFVEKPLCLTWAELDRVRETLEAAPGAPVLAVGFNRRFSPAFKALAAALAGRRGPLVALYRVNAGYLPQDHWTQGPQGGGRNRGEACHMYDCFRHLARGAIVGIDARSIDPGDLPHSRRENFSATLRYADGSVATLVYTALGPKAMPKERLEVFCDGEAYVLDDYKSLVRAGDGAVLWEARETDKGHREEMRAFGAALRGGEWPIAWDELAETTAATLRIDELLTAAE